MLLGRLLGYVFALILLIAAPGLQAQMPTPLDDTGVVYPYLSVMFQSDFEQMPAIEADEGWKLVEQGAESMLCINNYASTYGLFPVFLFGEDDWQDYSLEVQMQLSARDTGHAAILTRLDPNRWGYRHRLFFDVWGAGIAQYFYGGENGSATQAIGEFKRPIDSGWWYTVRAEVEGRVVRTVINGVAIAHYNMDFNPRGRLGIEVGPGARLCIDDLIVRSLDRTPNGMAGVRQAVVNQNANIRLMPAAFYDRVGVLRVGEPLYVIGWNEDRTWVQVRKTRSFVQGWVWAEYLDMVMPPTPNPLLD